MDCYSLQHGAKGVESEEFAVEFRGDKIVFVVKSAGGGKHYTLHTGPDSGLIDLHETHPEADGAERHRTLFALRSDDLPSALNELAPMLSLFLRFHERAELPVCVG